MKNHLPISGRNANAVLYMPAIIAFLLLCTVQSFGQTVDCSNPSVTYDMTAANAARSGAGNPTLTSWPFANTFSWETYATNASLNANATGIHGGSPNRTNVFYGGSSSSNNNNGTTNDGDNPSDLISNQIFNLYRGPITLTGNFLNQTTSTRYDESYVAIIPSVYADAVPASILGIKSVGIKIGGSIAGSLEIIDNSDAATASSTIATAAWPVSPTARTNNWYSLSATFDIQNGSVVITNVSVNGNTAAFTYPVIVGSSYYPTQPSVYSFQWVNSLRAVACVDDLLDDFTITTNPCYAINGNVYNDVNGLGDGTVNGTGINNPAGSQLYAVLVDENENIVQTAVTIPASGAYSFTNVPGGVFEVRLTTMTPGAAGTDAPPAALPAGWINTGENIGAAAGSDGSPNGSIVVGPAPVTNVNFGIQAYSSSSPIAFDCNTNSITYDMVPANAQISNSSNQSATGTNNPTVWASFTNKFAWESFGTDANLYGTAAAIPEHTDLTGANNATNVFFGGVWQNPNSQNTAQVSSDFISRSTFNLNASSGPITLVGRFLNKSKYTEENESYLFIVPNNYLNFQPMGRYTPPTLWDKSQRQGIMIGGNIFTGLLIIENNLTPAPFTIKSLPAGWGGLAPTPNTWYTMSVTFDVQSPNLVITDVSINGTTASFTYPIIVGPVATHSWINSLRVAASADDLMDDFTVATNPCIKGNVFNDLNGMGDGLVNGTGINTVSGNQLYVSLVDNSGKVVAYVPVAADGSYSFSNVYPGNYTMVLSIIVPIVGNSAPGTTLPTMWANTGEHIGLGPGSDGTANGKIITVPTPGVRVNPTGDVTTGSTTIINVNFGIAYGPLPIRLIDFKATKKGAGIAIDWVTATETNNQYFEIEKSSDGLNWQLLATVKGQGTSSYTHTYQQIDNNPFANKNYYRLKQVDQDGKFTYSNISVVDMQSGIYNNILSVSPNPVGSNNATITLYANDKAQPATLYIYDINGKLVKEYNWHLIPGINKYSLNNLNDLPGGIYNISVRGLQGNSIGSVRFIK